MVSKQLLFDRPVPAGWTVTKVDQIKSNEHASCSAGPFGSNISSKYFVEEGIPVIRGSNLRDDLTRFVPRGFVFVSPDRAQAYKGQHVKAGDLVFTCWGTLGQVGLIPTNGPYDEYIISNKQLKLRPNTAIADPLFLFYYFACPEMVKHIQSIAIGAAVPGINLGLLKNLDVVLPPITVQRKIVRLLSTYDDLIENNTRRIALLEGMAQALYLEWFVRFRFPGHEHQDSNDVSDQTIPSGWRQGMLSDMLVLQRGFDITKAQQCEGPHPVVSSSGPTSQHNAFKVKGPGVVIGRKGSLGTVFYVHDDHWPHDTTLWIKAYKCSSPTHAFFLLRALDLKQYDSGASNPTLNRNHIHGLPLIVPPASLVRDFDEIVRCMFNYQQMIRIKNNKLRQIRDLLLPRLISGQLDVEHLDIDVGEPVTA
jgi:type I restriction enzyme, S subunit